MSDTDGSAGAAAGEASGEGPAGLADGNGSAPEAPRSMRRLGSPAAAALSDLAAMEEDLQTALQCCERLMSELQAGGARPVGPDEVLVEALWTTALLCYRRCFTAGGRGMALTEDDVTATGLEGEVLAWHQMLRQLTKHYTDPAVNPREEFQTGLVVVDGKPSGVAISSTRQPPVDEQTVRQTGMLALALSRRVNERMGEHQSTVLDGAKALSAEELATLDEVALGEVAEGETSAEGGA